jgi:hypothetical protein
MNYSVNIIDLFKSFNENVLSEDIKNFLSNYFHKINYEERYTLGKNLAACIVLELPFDYYKDYINEKWISLDEQSIINILSDKKTFKKAKNFILYGLDYFIKEKEKNSAYAKVNNSYDKNLEYEIIKRYIKNIFIHLHDIPFHTYKDVFYKAIDVVNKMHNFNIDKKNWFTYYNLIDKEFINNYRASIQPKTAKEELIENIVSQKTNSLLLAQEVFSQSEIHQNQYVLFIQKSLEYKNFSVLELCMNKEKELLKKQLISLFMKLEKDFSQYDEKSQNNYFFEYFKSVNSLENFYKIIKNEIFYELPEKYQNIFLLSKDKNILEELSAKNNPLEKKYIFDLTQEEWSYFYSLMIDFQKNIQEQNIMSSKKIASYFPYEIGIKDYVPYKKNVLVIAKNFYEKIPNPQLSYEEKEKVYEWTMNYLKKNIQTHFEKNITERNNSNNYSFVEKQIQKVFLDKELKKSNSKIQMMKI